jgi:hypothetical protein
MVLATPERREGREQTQDQREAAEVLRHRREGLEDRRGLARAVAHPVQRVGDLVRAVLHQRRAGVDPQEQQPHRGAAGERRGEREVEELRGVHPRSA